MQVKTFESKDMATGLKMIRKELGPDALILSTKTIRTRSGGLLGKPMLEITAAIDGAPPAQQSHQSSQSLSSKKSYNASAEPPAFRHVVDDSVDRYLSHEQPEQQQRPAVQEIIAEQNNIDPAQLSLYGEVSELKELVKQLAQQITHLSQDGIKPDPAPGKQLRINTSTSAKQIPVNQLHGDHILSNLIERGINIETARTLTGFIRESLTEEELGNSEYIHSTLIDVVQNLIEVTPSPARPTSRQRRLAFVGPTGVGKTTTLAKVAASHLKDQSKSVALITIDTYRIAAVEQLKVYGDIMHLPVDIVITPEQLEQAINRHSDKDLILIDTAGRSPKDKMCIDELATFLKADLDIEKHLVLSATTREDELLSTIKQFNHLEITNTIFTKVDECINLGILLNVQLQNPNPLSYITNGQRVPEDILQLTPKLVAQLIMTQDEGFLHG